MSTEDNRSKKNQILKGTAVLMSAGMLANGVAASALPAVLAADKKESKNTAATSGAASKLNQFTADALAANQNLNVESSGVETVQATDGTQDEWANRLMVNINSRVNVRDTASADGNRVGALRPGDVAEIIGEENGWYQIQSGNLTGYISSDYVVTGDDARNQAAVIYKEEATSNVNGLRVRAQGSTDSAILSGLNQNQSLAVNEDAPQVDGWVAVNWGGTTGYVSADYVTVGANNNYTTGVTAEEEAEQQRQAAEAAAQEAAQKAAQQQAAAQQAQASQTSTASAAQNTAVSASQDETSVLAAIVQLEAGGSYQGMVAVGAVVLNRVASGSYPNSISGVVYQSGQFSPARRVSGLIASGGVSSAAYAAAQEALAGSDPTGGCLSFRSARTGHGGTNIGGNVFF